MATLGKVPAHAGAVYVRHRPEDTLLYQIVEAHYPTFCDLLERDAENSYLALESLRADASAMPDLYGHSITYWIALGPQRGKKVFSLQTLPPHTGRDSRARLAKDAGFSLHAGVAARADQRDKLERLCRYIARPAVSEKRLSLTNSRQIRYQLKTPYRDGTTHVIFNRGGHPPNHAWRAKITPGGRGRRRTGSTDSEGDDRTPAERRAAMTWAQRRVTHH